METSLVREDYIDENGNTIRQCAACNESKELTTGYYHSEGVYGRKCRKCRNKKRREWFLKNEEENRKKLSEWGKKYNARPEVKAHKQKANREWRKKNPDKCHDAYERNYLSKLDSKLRNEYGIDLEQYRAMLVIQNDSCAICNKTTVEEGKRLSVDHCHSTGKVRGLLCHQCNVGLGVFRDNKKFLVSAIKYLIKSENKPLPLP